MPSDFNTMQANMGLWPGGSPTPSARTPSPAETALQLSGQAAQQLAAATQMQTMGGPAGQIAAFGQQFQQQLSQIQQAQSLNPYVAQMLERSMQQGGASGMMPSPLMMTPPETGVFRPQTPSATFAPIAPMPTMPQFPTPFTPQLPQPQFRTAWEQESMQREQRADQLYSQIMQAPRAAGTMAGMGVGALMGAGIGRRFGPAGAMVGAAGGAALAGMSGAAEGMGTMAMAPMQPQIETRAMGAAMQRTSQNWVIGGPDVHPLGRGLSQEAGRGLAQDIRQMAGSQEFQAQTGGAFNREDLMKMTSLAGRTGLMDMEQSLPQIKDQLQRVSRTVSAFMQLTNDPDVTSVIRQMGQLRGMGMSMPEIESAAYQMKAYARAAGTSIGGVQAQGGLPGAATFQQAGLSPAAGFGVGMHAMASARQAVSTGTFTPMQLSMQGGVSGVAQRNVQAQAAYMSTPLFAAAAGGYEDGQWRMDPSNLSDQYTQGGGVQGMVTGAIRNIGQGVQQGGMGALANFGLMQKEISSTAAQVMTPGEMNLMRFRGAMRTGEMLGMEGADALSLGSQAMYGPDIARQMMLEAANPEYWKAQQRGAERSLDELGGQQYADIKERAPDMWDKMKASRAGRAVRGVGEAVAGPFAGAARGMEEITTGIQGWMEEEEARESGVLITRRERGRDITEQAAADFLAKNYEDIMEGRETAESEAIDVTNRQLTRAYEALGRKTGALGSAFDVASPIPIPYIEKVGEWAAGSRLMGDPRTGATRLGTGEAGQPLSEMGAARNVIRAARKENEQVLEMSKRTREREGAGIEERYSSLVAIGTESSQKGSAADKGTKALDIAAQAFASTVQNRASIWGHNRVTSQDRKRDALAGLAAIGVTEKDVSKEVLDTMIADMVNAARLKYPTPGEFDDVIATGDAGAAADIHFDLEQRRDKTLEDLDENIEAAERTLGLSDPWYAGWGERKGLKGLKTRMMKTPMLDIQGMAAAAATEGTGARERMQALFEKAKKEGKTTDKDFATFWMRMGEEGKAAGEDISEVLRLGAEDLEALGTMTKEVQVRAAMGAEKVEDAEGGVKFTPEELLKKESAYAPSGPEADRLKKGKAAARAGEEEFGDIVQNHFGPAAENLLKATQQFAKANEEGKAWWQLMDRG